MKVLIAAAIFGISCGMYGCSNESKFAGRTMPASEAPAAPASSPGAAIQTTADANAEVKIPAVVNPPVVVVNPPAVVNPPVVNNPPAVVVNSPAVVNPPAVVSSPWVDVTTVGSTTLTMMDTRTGLKWTNRRAYANWLGAINHCSALTYNGVSGWRLPTQEELTNAYAHGIISAARANWMTLADMQAYFWSTSSFSNSPNTYSAWFVNLGDGSLSLITLTGVLRYSVVCVQ